MDRNRLMKIVAVLTGVAVLALGFLLGVQPQLSAATTAVQQQADVDQQNAALRATVAQLQAENDELPSLVADRDARLASVPAGADMPELIRQLDQMAVDAGTTVTSFTTADAVSYEVPESAAVAAPAAEGAEGTESSDETAAPAEAATPEAPVTFTDPSVTAANFSTIAVTVDVQGSYAQALDFVDRLQKGPRLFLVTTITSSEPEDAGEGAPAGGQTWTVGGLVYVLQDGDAAPADGEPVTTAPTQAEGAAGDADATASGR